MSARLDALLAKQYKRENDGTVIRSDAGSALSSCSDKTPSRKYDSNRLPRGGWKAHETRNGHGTKGGNKFERRCKCNHTTSGQRWMGHGIQWIRLDS